MDTKNQKADLANSSHNSEAPKKYLCECIDCIGEWSGYYSNIEDLEKDIIEYCRSGKANYKIVE